MRPPSPWLAPQGQNHQAAPPRGRRGAASGYQGTPPSPPPPSPWANGGRPERQRPRNRPGGPLQPGGGHRGRSKRGRAPGAPGGPPALPTADRQRTGGTQEGANEAAHSEAGLGRAGERTGARRSLPPPPATLTGTRPAPTAARQPRLHCTERVYPRGARRRRTVTGTGATGHPTGKGAGEQRRGPPSPPSPPRSPPACGPRGRRPSAPPGPEGTSPLPRKGP